MDIKKCAKKRVGFLLWQAGNLWQREQKKALKKLGLTHVQFMLLLHVFQLEKKSEGVSQAQLAIVARSHPMMTSQVVRSLVEKGLIFRQASPQDSRVLHLQTTNRGRILVTQALEIVDAVDEEIFDKIEDLPFFSKSLQDFLK